MTRLWLALALLHSTAAAADLEDFLRSATNATRSAVVLRSDGNLIGSGTEGPIRDQVALLRNPDGDTYLELRSAALRVLVKAGQNMAYQSTGGSAATTLAMDQPIAGTDFTAEDMKPFHLSNYHSPSIADRNERQITVSFDPQRSQYSLVVVTFNQDTKIPVKTMYYVDTLNNLIKMRLDRDPVSLAGTWLPGSIRMEHFKLRTWSELSLRWSESNSPDTARFNPASFAQAPSLTWPTP